MKNAMKVTTLTDREIVITREFDAPRELVWDAMSKPELLKRWLFGPPGWEMTACEEDPRVDAVRVDLEGRLRVRRRLGRIVFRERARHADERRDDPRRSPATQPPPTTWSRSQARKCGPRSGRRSASSTVAFR